MPYISGRRETQKILKKKKAKFAFQGTRSAEFSVKVLVRPTHHHDWSRLATGMLLLFFLDNFQGIFLLLVCFGSFIDIRFW